MSGNDLVVGFICDRNWDILPQPVQCMARMALLDSLGASLVDTWTPVSRINSRVRGEHLARLSPDETQGLG